MFPLCVFAVFGRLGGHGEEVSRSAKNCFFVFKMQTHSVMFSLQFIQLN